MANVTISNMYDLETFVTNAFEFSQNNNQDPADVPYINYVNAIISSQAQSSILQTIEIASTPSLEYKVTNTATKLGFNYARTTNDQLGEISYKQSATLSGTGLLVSSIGDNTNITSSSFETSELRKEQNNVVYENILKLKATWGENLFTRDFNYSFFNLKNIEYQVVRNISTDGRKQLANFDINLSGDVTGIFNNTQANLTGTYKDYSITVNVQNLNESILEQLVKYSFSFSSKEGLNFAAAIDDNISVAFENQYDGIFDKLNIQYETIREGVTTKFSYVSTESNTELAEALNSVEPIGLSNVPTGLTVLEALLIGNDKITGTLGEDNLLGYAGNDSITSLDGNDSIDGGEGKDTINGGAGNDYVFGGAGNDSLIGGNENDYLDGGTGNDNLVGGLGLDTLWGDAGVDILNGGDGEDNIAGGQGRDSLTGGLGNDFFIFNSKSMTDSVSDLAFETGDGDSGINLPNMDRVLDFKTGADKILILIRDFPSGLNPLREISGSGLVEDNVVSRSIHQAMTKANAFFQTNAELTQDNLYFAYDSKNGYVFVDSDNNGFTDMAIQLVGINNPSKISADDIQMFIGQYPFPL